MPGVKHTQPCNSAGYNCKNSLGECIFELEVVGATFSDSASAPILKFLNLDPGPETFFD